MAKVKFREGTSQAYNNTTPDEHTFYKVTHGTDSDNDELYLGTVKVDNQITETNPSNDTSYYIPFVTDISSATHYTTGGNNGLQYTTMGGTTAIPGKGTLELGNAIPQGTSGNKTGSIKLYGATGDYYEISCPSFGPTETMDVELPTFTSSTTGGTGWLVGMAGGGNKGTASKPVYVDQYGIVNACDATVGGASTPVYMSSGTITACTSTVGSASRPVYMSAGVITSCSTMLSVSITGTASKLGTATVGGPSTPMYLSAGTATACTGTVGTVSKPVFMSSGVVTALTSTVGGVATPVYMSAGAITALTSTVGGVATPVYMSAGAITACTSTVGGTSTPVYMSAGTISACTATVGTTSIPVFMSAGRFYSCSQLDNTFDASSLIAISASFSTSGIHANDTSIIAALCSNTTSSTYIGSSAFGSCSNLIIAAGGAYSIYLKAFYSCSALTIALFPNCSQVGESAFACCRALTMVDIPNCVSIGLQAFYGCSNLGEITLNRCTAIGSSAFSGCHGLHTLRLTGSSIPTLGSYAFNNTPMSVSSWIGHYGSIYVPSSLYSSYRTAANWSEYAACFVSM